MELKPEATGSLELSVGNRRGISELGSRAVFLYLQRKAQIRGVVGVGGFLIIWEVLAAAGVVDPLLMSHPVDIARTAVSMFASGEIYQHIIVSGEELLSGYALGVCAGGLGGIALGRLKYLHYALNPIVDTFYVAPLVIFLPLLIIWLGIGLSPKIVIVFLGAVFPVLINTQQGVMGVDPRLVEAAKSYGASERDIFFKVVLLASIPYVVGGLRLAVGRALIMMVVGEFYMSSAGLGWLMVNAGSSFQTGRMFVAVGLVVVFAVAATNRLLWLERRACPWLHERQAE